MDRRRRLLGSAQRSAAEHRRRAGCARRLHPQPRRLRDPAHSTRVGRRNARVVRDAAARRRRRSDDERCEERDRGGIVNEMQFRDPALARKVASTLERLVAEMDRKVAVMHVCGSHEQAIAKFGLRSLFPKNLDVIMGPGCPVCVTDVPEVDEGVVLAAQGVRIATYGDMLRVPGTVKSLADAQAEGARIDVVYGVGQALELARRTTEPVVFFATGFETTAVA